MYKNKREFLNDLHNIRCNKIFQVKQEKNKISQLIKSQISYNKKYILKNNINLNLLMENNLVFDKICDYLNTFPELYTDLYQSLLDSIEDFFNKFDEEIKQLKISLEKENIKLNSLKINYIKKIKKLEKSISSDKEKHNQEININFETISKLNDKIKLLKLENNSLKTNLLDGTMQDLNLKSKLISDRLRLFENNTKNLQETVKNITPQKQSHIFVKEIDQIKTENEVFIQYNQENLKKIKSKNILIEELKSKYESEISTTSEKYSKIINNLKNNIKIKNSELNDLKYTNNELWSTNNSLKDDEKEYINIIKDLNLKQEKYYDKYKAIKLKFEYKL